MGRVKIKPKRRYLGSWTLPSGNSCNVYWTPPHSLQLRVGRPAVARLVGRGPRPLAAGEFPGDLPRRGADHGPAGAWSVGVKPGLPLLDEIVGRALVFRHDVRTWIGSGRVIAPAIGDPDPVVSRTHPHCCCSCGRALPPPHTFDVRCVVKACCSP